MFECSLFIGIIWAFLSHRKMDNYHILNETLGFISLNVLNHDWQPIFVLSRLGQGVNLRCTDSSENQPKHSQLLQEKENMALPPQSRFRN